MFARNSKRERDKMGDDGGNHAGVRASALVDVLPLSGTQERRQEMTDIAVVVVASSASQIHEEREREGGKPDGDDGSAYRQVRSRITSAGMHYSPLAVASDLDGGLEELSGRMQRELRRDS